MTDTRAWVQPRLKSLRTGGEPRVRQRLEQLIQASAVRPSAAQEELQREVPCFQTHRDPLHYPAREEVDAPPGSGADVSLGKQRQQRLRGCGPAWSRAGFTHWPRICVLVKNRDHPLLGN